MPTNEDVDQSNDQEHLARMASNCKQERTGEKWRCWSRTFANLECQSVPTKHTQWEHRWSKQNLTETLWRRIRNGVLRAPIDSIANQTGEARLEKFVPSTGPNKFSYGYFWVGVGSQIPGPVPSGLVCFGNPKTIAFYTRRLKGDRVTLEVQEKSPWKTPWQKRNFFVVSFFFHFDNFFKFSTKNHTQLLLMYLYENVLATEIKP